MAKTKVCWRAEERPKARMKVSAVVAKPRPTDRMPAADFIALRAMEPVVRSGRGFGGF